MSLDKSIKHGKERRKSYTGSKVFDRTCRNHGSCMWCMKNRFHKYDRIPAMLISYEVLKNVKNADVSELVDDTDFNNKSYKM